MPGLSARGGATFRWHRESNDRITELERLKLGLTQCIGCGCLSIGSCSHANPHGRAARLGPSPRYWVGDRPQAREGQQPASALPVAETPAGSGGS